MPNYGKVPNETVEAMRNAAQVAERVIASLPADSPDTWHAIAYEVVLDGILEDWVANGSTEWEEEDERNLSNLLRLCTDVARAQILRDVAFRALLKHAMHDWLENW